MGINRNTILALLKATILSVLIFCTISLYTVFEYVKDAGNSNLSIGWPLSYYQDFYVDCALHHGTFINSFMIDAALVWFVTAVIWFGVKYIRK